MSTADSTRMVPAVAVVIVSAYVSIVTSMIRSVIHVCVMPIMISLLFMVALTMGFSALGAKAGLWVTATEAGIAGGLLVFLVGVIPAENWSIQKKF